MSGTGFSEQQFTPVWSKHDIEIYHGDCTQVMDFLNDEGRKFDLLLTDPPYGIDYESLRGKEKIQSDALKETQELAGKFVRQMRYLLEPGATFYLFTGTLGPGPRLWETLFEKDQSQKYRKIRFRTIQTLVWDKSHFGTGHFYRYQWERILFGCFGKKPNTWNAGADKPDVLRYPRLAGTAMRHPTEKPEELIRDLILNSTNVGDSVLEPFGGSGVVADVCRKNQRKCVSIEIDEVHIKTQIERLDEDGNSQVSMF